MSKQLNEWLDNFVENGADPKDVTNWPKNGGSLIYDVDITDIIDPSQEAPSEVNLFLDDDRIDVAALLAAIKQNKIIRLHITQKSQEEGIVGETTMYPYVAIKSFNLETSELAMCGLATMTPLGSGWIIKIYNQNNPARIVNVTIDPNQEISHYVNKVDLGMTLEEFYNICNTSVETVLKSGLVSGIISSWYKSDKGDYYEFRFETEAGMGVPGFVFDKDSQQFGYYNGSMDA